MSATTKRLYLTRHGEAQHNVNQEYDKFRDAMLTDKGRKQCQQLHDLTKDTIQKKADLLVSSVMRRPMETMLLSYPDLVSRLEEQGKPPIILDILQEVNSTVCDIPTHPLEDLKASQDGIFSKLDFSRISPEYASKEGIFHPQQALERAKLVRKFLREREEQHIVVVGHGDILRTMVDGVSRSFMSETEKFETFRYWDNCEVKVFTFKSEDDDDAILVDVEGDSDLEPKDATAAPTTSGMAK